MRRVPLVPMSSSSIACGLSLGFAAVVAAAVAAWPSSAPAQKAPSHEVPPPSAGSYVTRSGTAMGTFVQVRAYFPGPPSPQREAEIGPKLELALAEIRRLERIMTTWREDSDVSRINAAAGKAAVPVSAEVLDVVKRSLVYSQRSSGAFDISFYALRGLWRFDDDLAPVLPDPAEIKRRLPLISWQKIFVDEKAGTVRLGRAGMAINLGGIGKGYAVDAAVALLKKQGLKDGLVQAGGDLMLFGSKDGQPFMAGVRDPRSPDPGDYFAVCPVADHAFSTAGDYERAFVKDGVRYHHILDPRTGQPARKARSVTVYARDATTADGLDDAVLIMGATEGLKLIESIPDAGAVIVDADNKVHISKRLQGLVRIVHPPTPGI